MGEETIRGIEEEIVRGLSFLDRGNSVAESQPDVALRFYRRLAENSLGLMCCHDLDGTLLWINPAAASSLGYSTDESVGTRLDTYLVPEVRSLFASYLARIRQYGTDSGVMRLQARNGERRIWMYRNVLSDEPELPPHVLGHAVDITQQFWAEQALKKLFEQGPIAYLEVDPRTGIRRVNRAACELLGFPEHQILRQEAPPAIGELLGACAATSDEPRLAKFTRNDGRILSLEIRTRTILAADSSPAGFLCALIDVSERVRAETEIRNLNAQLEARVVSRTAELRRSNSELQEFAYVASHDLQAPLKQVGGVLERLGSKSSDSETAELLGRAQADVRRMSMLIDSLLRYALVSNTVVPPAREVLLAAAVEESLMSLASAIASSEAVVIYHDLPPIFVDESNFVQLFQNLIGNAIKYRKRTDALRVRIFVENSDDFWTVAVEDNGIGIDAGNSELIFEPFRRLHGKEYSGSGIGLAICKKIVERIGGHIWLESQPGRGSTFRFTIPR